MTFRARRPRVRAPFPSSFASTVACLIAGTVVGGPVAPAGEPPADPVADPAFRSPSALSAGGEKTWDFVYEVLVGTDPRIEEVSPPGEWRTGPCGELIPPPGPRSRPIRLEPLWFETGDVRLTVAFEGAWTAIDAASLRPSQLIVRRHAAPTRHDAIRDPAARSRLEEGRPLGTADAITDLGSAAPGRQRVTTLQWRVEGTARSRGSRVDERIAFRVPWPQAWPAAFADALAPQPGIESDDPLFTGTVARLLPADREEAGPYETAKRIVAWCIANVRTTGRGDHPAGLDVDGALAAARRGSGTEADLVLVTTAMLRAAGIPARVVIGIEEVEERNLERLAAWGEFHLPGSGWIPYDPGRMRSYAVQNRRVQDAWPWFGTIPDLRDRVGLSFLLQPVGTRAAERPGLWGLRVEGESSLPDPLHSRVLVGLNGRAVGR